MKYVIGGFSNCGIHSLAKYLENQGHEVIQMYDNLASKEFEIILHQEIGYGHKIAFITRKNNKYKTDCDKFLEQFPDGRVGNTKIEIYKFEEMIKKENFPYENKTVETPK